MSHPTGLLQPLPIPKGKWESISMNFIIGLPKVQGKDCIFVVDRLTKYTHLFAISAHYIAAPMAELFFKEIFRLHSLLKTIISDSDICFMGGFWQELFRLVGMELTLSTNYHPQTDGQTEIVNKWLEGYLRNYVNGQHQAWLKWLHLGEYYYNTSHHMSIGLLEPRFGSKRVRISSELSRITWLQRRTNRSCMPIGVGWRGSSRLHMSWSSPQGNKIHNIFHVSCLKKALGQQVTVTNELPPMDDEGHLVLQPEAIIDSRERRLWSKTVQEFLVRWKNLSDEDATWESEEIL
eukprot:PITA_06528